MIDRAVSMRWPAGLFEKLEARVGRRKVSEAVVALVEDALAHDRFPEARCEWGLPISEHPHQDQP